MARWIGAQGQVHLAKKAKTCPHCDVTHREPQIRNEKNFFQSDLEDFPNPYGLEQLSSSIFRRFMAEQRLAQIEQIPGQRGLRTFYGNQQRGRTSENSELIYSLFTLMIFLFSWNIHSGMCFGKYGCESSIPLANDILCVFDRSVTGLQRILNGVQTIDTNSFETIHLRQHHLRARSFETTTFETSSLETTFTWDFFTWDHDLLRPIHLRTHSFEDLFIWDHIRDHMSVDRKVKGSNLQQTTISAEG